MESKNTIEKGELVRFKMEYGGRVGIVLEINSDEILVKDFDNNKHQIEKENIELYADFVEGERRARKLKTVYEEFFGARYDRMPSKNLRKLLSILQKHGISYNPKAKRADDPFRMHRNKAYLTNAERTKHSSKLTLGEEISRLLPKWIEPEELPPSSRDPLGLQAFAMHLADKLLPGMTVFTSRTGYFFFLSWALKNLNKNYSQNGQFDVLKRLERALVLCETLYHGKDGLKDCIHLGNRSKMRLLAKSVGKIEIPDRILKRQDATGCYNLYKNSMISFGFWEEDEEAAIAGLLPYSLTELGEKLADLFEKRDYTSELMRWAKEEETKRDATRLENWGKDMCFLTYSSPREKKAFLEGFLFAKGQHDRVVCDANLRLKTLQALDHEGLLIGVSIDEMQAPVTDEADSAAVSELEDKEPGYNQFFLSHYFDNRKKNYMEPFVDAAIYEMLGISLNAIFAGVYYQVKNNGRTNIPEWIAKDLVTSSKNIDFWDAKLEEAVKRFSESERKLISIILSLDTSTQSGVIEAGLMLLMRLLSDEFNRHVLNSHLAECPLEPIFGDLTAQKGKNMRQVLEMLIKALISHHRAVFERKHKERWLDIDGDDVYAFDIIGDMALGFHSYRFPQLMSIIRDIELSREDLHNGGK